MQIQEGKPLPQHLGIGGPPQQPEPLLPQPFDKRIPYGNGVGVSERPHRQLDGPEPLDTPGHDVTVGPVDLVRLAEQRPGREPGDVLVDNGPELHACVPLADRPVGHGDSDPGRPAKGTGVADLGAGAGDEEIGTTVGFGDTFGVGEGGDESDERVIACDVDLLRGETGGWVGNLPSHGSQAPNLRTPPPGIGVTPTPDKPQSPGEIIPVSPRRLFTEQRDNLGARRTRVQQGPPQPGMQTQPSQLHTP